MSDADNRAPAFTAFAGDRMIARGDLAEVARAAHGFADAGLIVFEDATGRVVDLDLRGSARRRRRRGLRRPILRPRPARGRARNSA